MSVHPPLAAPIRAAKRTRITPASAGLPDPRPVTDYFVDYAESGGRSIITVALDAPCIIRDPMWSAINIDDGSSVGPVLGKAVSPTAIQFIFDSILDGRVCFLDVPLQDMQVQNHHGGFVRPGAKWFRGPS